LESAHQKFSENVWSNLNLSKVKNETP
jgi:hypothetical protein